MFRTYILCPCGEVYNNISRNATGFPYTWHPRMPLHFCLKNLSGLTNKYTWVVYLDRVINRRIRLLTEILVFGPPLVRGTDARKKEHTLTGLGESAQPVGQHSPHHPPPGSALPLLPLAASWPDP